MKDVGSSASFQLPITTIIIVATHWLIDFYHLFDESHNEHANNKFAILDHFLYFILNAKQSTNCR